MEKQNSLNDELAAMVAEAHEHHHEHHHHHDGECCHDHNEHEHHHHENEECCHHEHDEHEHHHEHDEHEHHHEHDEHCGCEEHEHHHHHGHDADEIFQSWGVETPKRFTADALREILTALDDDEKYGVVLRAKGIVPAENGTWLHFDHVPNEIDVRAGTSAVTGRLCVIGSGLKTDALTALFGV